MLRRTGFKRPERPARTRPALPSPVPPEMQRGTMSQTRQLGTSNYKRQYIRSPALMRAYGKIPCQHCGRDDGTICGAHANWSVFGKGGHIKADDNRAASLCSMCHIPLLDQGSELSKAERIAMWWAAHVKTIAELMRRGLWPSGLPVPDTDSCPI